jgi:hypothetical protein
MEAPKNTALPMTLMKIRASLKSFKLRNVPIKPQNQMNKEVSDPIQPVPVNLLEIT